MKNNSFLLSVISLLVVLVMSLNLAGCTTTVSAENLMESVTANKVTPISDISSNSASVTDFAVRLFKAIGETDKNTLISPLSVLCALSMTANGADSDTLTQMEQVLGLSADELNKFIYSYMRSLPENEKYTLKLANSIWFTNHERFTVNTDFLQCNADYYGADIYKAPFDKSTLNDINDWVKTKTDGKITKILDEIPEEAVMYLINALSFEAEWNEVYNKEQIRDGFFTASDKEKQKVPFMHCEVNDYIKDTDAEGFIKYYKDGKYAFVALLPDEDISVSDYIEKLDGKKLNKLLSDAENLPVNTSIPKFSTEYSVEMSEIFKSIGMTKAFDPDKADFSILGKSKTGNIYINKIFHKTFISVSEKGTKAGAAASVEIANKMSINPIEPKTVYLNRPFVYMLIDCNANIPFFIGTMTDVK